MHRYKTSQFDDLVEVFHNAHLRRSADVGRWLRQYFDDRRKIERPKKAKAPFLNMIFATPLDPVDQE